MGGIESSGPWLMGMENGLVDLIVGKILSTYIDTEVVELAGHLCLQLEVSRIAALVVKFTAAIELTGYVELPKFERSLIR